MTKVSSASGAQTSVQPVTITIKKNQGITQALFDLVKNENLSGGKIDSTEWANALKVLNEIQADREKNGQANIYTGGAGNNWHKNYIVHEGDKIEFTADEIQKLYNALGVTLKGTQATDQVEESTDNTQTEQTGNVEESTGDTQTEPPKSQASRNPRRTDCPGVFYDETTKTHYKIENGQYVEFKGKNGGKVYMVKADGSYFERAEQSADGSYWTDYVDANDKNVDAKKYDKSGNMIVEATYDETFNDKFSKRIDYANNQPVSKELFTYNSDGSYTFQYFLYNEGWTLSQTSYYDKNGKETNGILQDDDGNITFQNKYLDDGSQLTTYTREDGSKYYWMSPKNGDEYECDENGNPIK